MPGFSRLTDSDIQALRSRRGQPLPEYSAFLSSLYRGSWAAIMLVEGETRPAVKRRTRAAARHLGIEIQWRRSVDSGLLFCVLEGPEEPQPQVAEPEPLRLPAPPAPRCSRCSGRMRVDHHADGDELVCTMCGHVQYPAGFTPLALTDEGEGKRRRSTSHGGMRL